MYASKTFFWGSTLAISSGYLILHRALIKKYPEVPLWELPKSSRIQKISENKLNVDDKYIAYYDNYKVNLKKINITTKELTDEFLKFPTFASIIDNGQGNYSSFLTSKVIERIKTNQHESTVIKWGWKSLFLNQFFNTLCQYGYPWRLMNGGYHEILLEKKDDGTIDVYFCNAHEYDFKREGKTVPKFVLMLHKDFTRVVLNQITSKYE